MSNKVKKDIEKVYGKGSKLQEVKDLQPISTGSIGLDIATGIGGIPRGKIIELRGWESSGKSTLALHILASAQKAGIKCLLVDGENSFDAKYASNLGISVEELKYVQIDEKGSEACYDAAEKAIVEEDVQLVIFDSQTSLIPKKMIEDPHGTANMALQARLMSASLPKFSVLALHNNCTLIYISQYRTGFGQYGSFNVTTGGNALKFYAHMIIEISKKVIFEDGKIEDHNRVTCKISKNKVAPPYKSASFDIIYGEGIDKVGELVEVASELGIVKLAGSWYSYNGSTVGQGVAKAKAFLLDNPEAYEEIKSKVLNETKKA